MVITIRRASRVALLAAMAVLLGACLRAEQALTLNPDDTVDGTITLAVSQELIDLSGQDADDVLQQMTEGDSPVPDGVDVETSDYDEDGFVGKTFTFSGATLEQVSQDGDLTITRQGDTFVVDGALDLSAGATDVDPNDPTVQGLLEQFEVSISVTFPGAVSEHDGELDGNTVTWAPAFGESTNLHAVGSAVDDGSSSVLIWIVVGLLVLVVVVVVMLMLRGHRKPTEAPQGGFQAEGSPADVPDAVPPPPVATEAAADPAPAEPASSTMLDSEPETESESDGADETPPPA